MALDLTSETTSREPVRWEGVEYELGDVNCLTAGGVIRMEQTIERLQVLEDDTKRLALSEDEIVQVDADMMWLIGMALPGAPADALGRLARALPKAMLLIEAFADDSTTTDPAMTPSSTSSPESNDSTGEARPSGPA